MIRRILAAALLCLIGVAALAQSPIKAFPPGMFDNTAARAPAGGGGAAAWTSGPAAMYNNVGYGSSNSSFNITMTTAATDTLVVVIGTTNGTVTGVTSGGNAMTLAASSGTAPQLSIYYIIGAYTNPTIVVTAGAALQYAGIAYGKWTGASSVPSGTVATKAFSFGGAPHTLSSLTVPSGGVLVAGALAAGSAGFNQGWPNTTEFAETDNGVDYNLSAAYHATAGAIGVQITTGDIAAAAITMAP